MMTRRCSDKSCSDKSYSDKKSWPKWLEKALFTFLVSLSMAVNAYDCSTLEDYNPSTITTGSIVQHNDNAYECLVGGWCQQDGPWEPGIGWAWQYAWSALGTCDTNDTLAPEISFNFPGTVANGTLMSLKAGISDEDGIVQTLKFYLDGGLRAEYSSLNGITDFNYSWTATTGYHTVTLEATDDLGKTTTASQDIIVSANEIPLVTISAPPAQVEVGKAFEVSANATDPDGTINTWDLTIYRHTLDGPQTPVHVASGWGTQASMSFSGEVSATALVAGEYILFATVTDIAGATAQATRVFEVGQIGSTPVFNATIPSTANVGENLQMSFSAMPFHNIEPGLATVSINGEAIDIVEGWGTTNSNGPYLWVYSGQWNWTPTAPGSYEVLIQINHMNFPDPILQTVEVLGGEPTFLLNGPQQGYSSDTLLYSIEAKDLPSQGELMLSINGDELIPDERLWTNDVPYALSAEYTLANLLPGQYEVEAELALENGNVLSDSIILNVENSCYVGGATPWDPQSVYLSGDLVYVDFTVYEAQFWTRSDNPETTNSPWGPWKIIGYLTCI